MPDILDGLPSLQFWSLELHLWAIAILTVWQVPRVVAALDLRRSWWIAAFAAAALGWGLSTFVAPRTSRIFYDEQIYQHIGQSLADRHRAAMCNEGTADGGRLECVRPEYNKQPNAWPHLISVGYRIAGANDRWAFALNNLAAALLPLVVFGIGALAAGPREGACAALIAALMPQMLLWSNTAASEPTAAVAGAAAAFTALWFARDRSSGALASVVVMTSYAAQFRPESPLIVIIVTMLALPGCAGNRRRLLLACASGAALAVPLLLHVYAVSGHGWGTAGPRVATSFVWDNLAVNGPFYLTNIRFPAVYSLLALIGLVSASRLRAAWILAAYFALFFAVYLSFYAGSYDYGADVRYSLLTYPPLAALGGIGAARLAARIGRYGGAIVSVVLLAQFTWFLPLVRAVGEEAWSARADVMAAARFADALPRDALVLTHNPSMFLLRGRNAAQMSIATVEPDAVARWSARFTGGVYLHWNFWCNVPDPVQAAFCTRMRERFTLELVRESRARDFRYALYRVGGR